MLLFYGNIYFYWVDSRISANAKEDICIIFIAQVIITRFAILMHFICKKKIVKWNLTKKSKKKSSDAFKDDCVVAVVVAVVVVVVAAAVAAVVF
jgi:hypothetical protein